MDESAGGRPPITYNRTELSDALRARRESLGLTTYEAAALLGVSQASIAQAETGRWHISAAKAAERLAAYDAWGAVNEQPAGAGDGLDPAASTAGAPSPRRPLRRAAIR